MKIRFGLVLPLVALFCMFFLSNAFAGIGPENTVVVVNAESWASVAVANEYIHLRDIPANNVIYLEGIHQFESIGIDQFRELILNPVLETIKERGLTKQIDCVTYSSDIPYAINVRPDVGDAKLGKVITPTASLNGLTFLYDLVLAKDIKYLDLDVNYYARNIISHPGKVATKKDLKRIKDMNTALQEGDWRKGEKLTRLILKKHSYIDRLHYNLATCLARQGRVEEAMVALARAVDKGWTKDRVTLNDRNLTALRTHRNFMPLVERMRNRIFDIQPAEGFRNSYRWTSDGKKGKKKEGRSYMLSTMLGVTSGRGNSVSEVVAGLRRSVAVDGKHPRGTIYFMVNEDIRTKARQNSFPSALRALKKIGMRAEVVEGTLPQNKGNVAGLMAGRATFDWKKSGSTMLPGAICEHLTSLGGVMRQRSGQTPCSEFIRNGAAGTSGTVTEPYALQSKFPHPFIHVHYARGCTLAEAFYQSVDGPYQLLIVGDPLCRPWANVPTVKVEGLKAGDVASGKVELAIKLIAKGAARKTRPKRYELFVDGLRVAECTAGKKKLLLNTEKLSDGYHEATVVMIGRDKIETQARLMLPFVAKNNSQSFSFATKATGDVVWGEPITFELKLPGATKFTIRQNNREVASVAGGEQVKVTLDSKKLGMGPVKIWAEGIVAEKVLVKAAPILLNIVPPPALPAIKLESGQSLTNGLLLTLDGGKPTVIEDTFPGDWLRKVANQANQPLKLTGIFEVAKDDVYQFQLSDNCEAKIFVDAKLLPPGENQRWNFIPVALKAGKHRLEVTGSTVNSSNLQLRFGGGGAQSLDGKRFQH